MSTQEAKTSGWASNIQPEVIDLYAKLIEPK
jgi:hypothetical protein